MPSVACLPPGLELTQNGLSWDNLPEHLLSALHVAWAPHDKVAGSERRCPGGSGSGSVPREPEDAMGPPHLTWEVRKHHWCHTLLGTREPPGQPDSRGGEVDPVLDGDESRSHCGRVCRKGVTGVALLRRPGPSQCCPLLVQPALRLRTGSPTRSATLQGKHNPPVKAKETEAQR